MHRPRASANLAEDLGEVPSARSQIEVSSAARRSPGFFEDKSMRLLVVCTLFVAASLAFSQAPKKGRPIDQIERDIADQKKRLALLEAELAAAKPKAKGAPKVLTLEAPEVGSSGTLQEHFEIREILAADSMLVSPESKQTKRFILKRSTRNEADGKVFMVTGHYGFTGTEKIGTKTYYVLEVVPVPKPKD